MEAECWGRRCWVSWVWGTAGILGADSGESAGAKRWKNTSEAEFSDNDRCEVDATDFVFKQSEGTVMSRKTQRRMLRQKKAEVVWAGPAVVREQAD